MPLAKDFPLIVPSLQQVYDESGAAPHITVDGTNGPLTVQDNATPIGDIFRVRDNSSDPVFALSPTNMNFGPSARRTLQVIDDPTSRGGVVFFPDGLTQTTAISITGFLDWTSTITSNIAGGGGIDDGLGGMVNVTGTLVLADQGNLFNTALLFNMGMDVQLQDNSGPIYTMIDQPSIFADGGSFSASQHNALRMQARWGPNINGGSVTQTSCQYLLFTAFVDATVGSASVTTMDYMRALNTTLTAGGTIGTLTVLGIDNISGATTIRGIDSAMSNGTFIRHTGTSVSEFAATIHMNNSVPLTLGSVGANRVQLLRPSAGVMRMIGIGGSNNEGLDWDFDAAVNSVGVTSTTGAGLRIGTAAVSIGTTSADPSANWQFALTPGAKTITLAGDFARALFTASANVTINAALSTFSTWTINSPGGTIGTGSVVNAANMIIQTAPGVGTNRYGLLITSNPSGGTLNYAFRQSNASARARFDGRLDINRGIALGAGGVATLGATGGSGPTATAQSQWVEIDIGGTPHWIPVWV